VALDGIVAASIYAGVMNMPGLGHSGGGAAPAGLGCYRPPETGCPTSILQCHLKQVLRSTLSGADLATLDFLFSGFFSGLMPEGTITQEFKRLADKVGAAWNSTHSGRIPRRYDGDGTLPGGRYSTICDASGNDNGTLVNELREYANPQATDGHLEIEDALEDSQIYLRFYPFNQEKSELLMMVKGIQYEIRSVSIPGVLDLRRPDAANWLARTISRLELEHNGARLPCFNREPLDAFPQLLGPLFDQCRGGGNFSIIVGSFLRRLGLAGLVFPSARSDAQVHFQAGEVTSSRGWSFVDYREADPPSILGFFERRPGWPSPLVREGGDDNVSGGVAFAEFVRFVTTDYKESDGGFSVSGLARRIEAKQLLEGVRTGICVRMPSNAVIADTLTKFIAGIPVEDAVRISRMLAIALAGSKQAQRDVQQFRKANRLEREVDAAIRRCADTGSWKSSSRQNRAKAWSGFAGFSIAKPDQQK
jgi:hypothetical protein